MNRSIITATNTVAQLQKQMDIISHNMANIDTTGYKRREASFTDLLFQEFQNQPAARPEPQRFTPAYVRQGVGAKLGQSQMIMAQGAIKSTGRELDTAFTKEGQFYKVQVQEENGTAMRYTRDGAFYLSPLSENEVILVTGNGHPVLDENNQPIHIFGSPKEYAVDANGRLTVTMHNGARQSFDLGVIQINKPQFLEQKKQ